MMDRRGFLGAILAAGVAPALVRAASLMPVRARPAGAIFRRETQAWAFSAEGLYLPVGHNVIRNVRIYNRALSNIELVSITHPNAQLEFGPIAWEER